MAKKVLITGAAGFIGFHLSKRLTNNGYNVFGLDNLNAYYSPSLKLARLKELGVEGDLNNINIHDLQISKKSERFQFIRADVADHEFILSFLGTHQFDVIIHLAAQAGVRHSLKAPRDYLHSNVNGFLSILEGARTTGIDHLIYASTSSVYGLNKTTPFSEKHVTDHPMSLYAATKKSNEMMAHAYSHLFEIPTTGLRFFTVYGPWGRPDMALFLFTKAIFQNKPIKVFNQGQMFRDFTFVDDIVESIFRLIPNTPKPSKASNDLITSDDSTAPFRILNIGNSSEVSLLEYISCLEKHIGKTAKKELHPLQDGDLISTISDSKALYDITGFKPRTAIDDGIKKFVEWYRLYYHTMT